MAYNDRGKVVMPAYATSKISDHQQSLGYEDGPWKGPRPPLLAAADFAGYYRHTA